MNKVSSSPIISVKNLSISFIKKNDIVKVVNNISFDLLKYEVLGIVGESGSGKSITAFSILNLKYSYPEIIRFFEKLNTSIDNSFLLKSTISILKETYSRH